MITLFLDETGTHYTPESSKNWLLTPSQQKGNSNDMLGRLGSPRAAAVKRTKVVMACPPHPHRTKHWACETLKGHFR